jgi:hypothetical protein
MPNFKPRLAIMAAWLAMTGRWFLKSLPLVSGVPDCRWSDFTETCKEIFVIFLLSTSPIWLGSLIKFGVNPRHPKDFSLYYEALRQTLESGEMLIYATAAIAPIFYFALVKGRDAKRDYPSRISHIVSALLIFMIGTTLFGVQRAGTNIDPDFILPGSLYLYGFAMFVIFLATMYRNWRDVPQAVLHDAETRQGKEEDDFSQRARAHRES